MSLKKAAIHQYVFRNSMDMEGAAYDIKLSDDYIQYGEAKMALTGKTYIIVSIANGGADECETTEQAMEKAQAIAHKTQADVYIYQAVSKVSPKRDVVVTPLATGK